MYEKVKELAKSKKLVRGFLIVCIAVRIFFQLIKKYFVSWKEERKKKKNENPLFFNKDGSVSARGKALAQKSRFIRCFLVSLIVVRVFCQHVKKYYADWRTERKQGLNNSDERTFEGKWMCGWKIAFSMCVAAIVLLCCDSIMASYAAMGRRQDDKVTEVGDKEVDLESKMEPLQEVSFHYTRGIDKKLFEDEVDLGEDQEAEYPKETTSENGTQKMDVSSSGFSGDLYEGENDVLYPLVIRNSGSEELTDIRVNAEIMQLAGYDEKMAEVLQREAEKAQEEESETNPEEPDTDITMDDSETNPEEPDTETEEPGTNPEEPDMETEEPVTNPEEPDTDTTADGSETNPEEPDTETEEPETKPEEPDTDTKESETKSEKSDTDTAAEAPERKPMVAYVKTEEVGSNPETADGPEVNPEAADETTDNEPEADPEAADEAMGNEPKENPETADETTGDKPKADSETADNESETNQEESDTTAEEPETVTEETDTSEEETDSENKIFIIQELIGEKLFESADLIVSGQIIEIDNLKELTFSLLPGEEVTLYLKLSEECTYGKYKDCLNVEAAELEQPCSIDITAKVYAKEGEPWQTTPDRAEPVIAYDSDVLEGTMDLTDAFEFQVLESEGFDSGIALVECYLNGSLQELESEVVETGTREDGEVATGIKYKVPFTEEGINSLTIKAVDQEGNQCIRNLDLQVVKEEDYHVVMSKKIELTVDPAMAYGDTQIFNLRDCVIENDSIEDLVVNIEEVLVRMNGGNPESVTEKIRSLNMAIVVDGEKIYDMPIGAIDSVNTCDFTVKGRGKDGEVNHKAYLVFSGMLESEETFEWHEDDLEVQLQIKFAQAE